MLCPLLRVVCKKTTRLWQQRDSCNLPALSVLFARFALSASAPSARYVPASLTLYPPYSLCIEVCFLHLIILLLVAPL